MSFNSTALPVPWQAPVTSCCGAKPGAWLICHRDVTSPPRNYARKRPASHFNAVSTSDELKRHVCRSASFNKPVPLINNPDVSTAVTRCLGLKRTNVRNAAASAGNLAPCPEHAGRLTVRQTSRYGLILTGNSIILPARYTITNLQRHSKFKCCGDENHGTKAHYRR